MSLHIVLKGLEVQITKLRSTLKYEVDDGNTKQALLAEQSIAREYSSASEHNWLDTIACRRNNKSHKAVQDGPSWKWRATGSQKTQVGTIDTY